MKAISIDIETFSSVDLAKCGIYRYCESPDFEILLFGYSIDGGEVQVIDLACGEKIPPGIISALSDPTITKWAFNSQFERICLSRFLGFQTGKYLVPQGWYCTMVWSATLGLPLSLEGVGAVLGLEKQKLKEGKNLIKYFCTPCAATKTNGGRRKNLHQHDPEKWENFKAYNKRDVETELGIQERFSKFPVPDAEWDNYRLDQAINDRGIALDMPFVKQAIRCDGVTKTRLRNHMQELTSLENPNSVQQLKEWLSDNGLETDTLGKATVAELIKTAPPDLKEVLSLRQELAKSSVKKYTVIENAVGSDGRARGLIQFYGANRTGRFSGRLIQVQNLPRNYLPDLEDARNLIKSGMFEAVDMLYDSTSSVLSQLIRTAFVPSPKHRFIVSDYSSIEARIIAWLAGEKWVIDVFNDHGRIYEMTASRMFGVPMEQIVKGNPAYAFRQEGKIACLACGYQGSVGALKAMGALNMGLSEGELPIIVAAWRKANPNIVKFWRDVEEAAITAVKDKRTVEMQYGLAFYYRGGVLFIRLPSGRSLAYVRPRVEPDERFNKEKLTYEGVLLGKWGRMSTYGGKLAENCVQAIARDCLAESLLRLDKAGYKIAFHVHDEVVLDVPRGTGSLEEVVEIMGRDINWAPGLPMRAESFETDYYKKD